MSSFTYMSAISLLIFCSLYNRVNSIDCFQCSGTDSSEPFQCNEYLNSDTTLQAVNCSAIHNAQFCVKHVGRYEVESINCYQCNSSLTMECGDGLMNLDGGILEPTSCNHVYGAQYCVKMIGGISTKRFCSSYDLGNYCHYVQQPGDKLNYRTCIFTCSTDGCNASSKMYGFTALICFCLVTLRILKH